MSGYKALPASGCGDVKAPTLEGIDAGITAIGEPGSKWTVWAVGNDGHLAHVANVVRPRVTWDEACRYCRRYRRACGRTHAANVVTS